MTIIIKKAKLHLVNKATGTLARQTTGMTILNFQGRIRKREAQEVAIMVAMDKIRVKKPIIIFLGKDLKEIFLS